MKISSFYDITASIPMKANQRFGETCHPHLQDQRTRQTRNYLELGTCLVITFLQKEIYTQQQRKCWKLCFLCGPCQSYISNKQKCDLVRNISSFKIPRVMKQKKWSRVPLDLDPRMDVLARACSNLPEPNQIKLLIKPNLLPSFHQRHGPILKHVSELEMWSLGRYSSLEDSCHGV
jgi:hypothetical protein